MKLLLSDLVEAARETTRRQRGVVSEATLRAEAEELGSRSTAGRFAAALAATGVSVIAEVKGASPVRGTLRDDFVPVDLAAAYADNGAAAVSVLTEQHFFAGDIEHLLAVSSSIELPTLRKDFVTELYQVFRAATAGASAVLLIAELLDGAALPEFVEAARSVGLDALVEFHRPSLLAPSVDAGSGIVGINNRNLDTMELDFEHALRLAPELPRDVLTVAESAVSDAEDVRRVARRRFDAILVGTALVTADDPGMKLRELVEAGGAENAGPAAGDAGEGEDVDGGEAGDQQQKDATARAAGQRATAEDLEELDLPDDIDLSGAVLL
ncbi:MAG: indole-3-glycerol phosphate synthase TrpC [Acidobacteriota bacterium]|jgi:indole-3-glycerol phosphate synthase